MAPAREGAAVVVGLDRTGLALVRALGRTGVPVTAVSWRGDDVGARSRYVGKLRRVGPKGVEDAVVRVLEELSAQGRPVVFADSDESIELLQRRWADVSRLAELPLPEPGLVRRLQRKELLARAAREVGVPAPATVLATDDAAVRGATLTPPLLVKPVAGKDFEFRFQRKGFLAHDVEGALAAVGRAREAGFETIVQELIPCSAERVFSLLTYIDRAGRPLASLTGRKLRQLPAELGSSTVFHVAWEPRVHEAGMRLLNAVGYTGLAHVELIEDPRDGELKLIEVNTRAPVWVGAAHADGFDLVRTAYDDLTCAGAEAEAEAEAEAILRSETTWVDLARDVVQAVHRRDARPRAFLAPYLRRPRARAVLAYDDPAPVLVQLHVLSRRLTERAGGIFARWHSRGWGFGRQAQRRSGG